MRIISKFHDYYDTVQAYGFDDTVIYIRKREEIFNKVLLGIIKGIDGVYIHKYQHYQRQFCNLIRNTGILYFCGKKYPFIEFEIKVLEISPKYKYYYDYRSLNEFILDKYKKKKKQLKTYAHKPRFRFGNRFSEQESLKWYFDIEYNSFEDNIKLHEKYETPVFAIYNRRDGRPNLILNPVLKDLNFQSVFGPFQAHQEIDMFLSGVMQSKERNIIQISDEDQKHKKGFDDMSFKPKMRAKYYNKLQTPDN